MGRQDPRPASAWRTYPQRPTTLEALIEAYDCLRKTLEQLFVSTHFDANKWWPEHIGIGVRLQEAIRRAEEADERK